MTDSQTGAEKRSEPRYAVAARVLVQPMNGPLMECAANDISAHGMYLEMDAPLAQNTVLKIGPPGFEVQAKVVFVLTPEKAPPGRAPGVGV